MITRKILTALPVCLALAANAGLVAADQGKSKGNSNSAAACKTLAAALQTDKAGIHGALRTALIAAVAAETSGLDLNMWAAIVDRDGVVCAVAFSGPSRGSQWPGSRVIAAQKAHTANAFSLHNLALSTANLYSAVQPGGSLYGLQHSNPIDTEVAYKGPAKLHGQANDPMVLRRAGGVNVFGGGLALYDANHKVIGGVGVSGDTSCADHNIAWRVRNNLLLDNLAGVGGVGPNADVRDGIVFDIVDGASAGGFGHPTCLNSAGAGAGSDPAASQGLANSLPSANH